MIIADICSNFDRYSIHDNGNVSRICPDGFKVNPSSNWRIIGAVEYRVVFGREVIHKRYSFEDIKNKRVPWRWKNGKQRCFLMDYDHGARRIWGTSHDVRYFS